MNYTKDFKKPIPTISGKKVTKNIYLKIKLVIFVLVFFGCNDKKTSIHQLEIIYLPPDLTTQSIIDCSMMSGKFNFKSGHTIITQKDFIKKIERELDNLYADKNNLTVDTRIQMLIHFNNKNVDTLCFGEYFGILKNGVKQNDDREIIKLIKEKIDYDNFTPVW